MDLALDGKLVIEINVDDTFFQTDSKAKIANLIRQAENQLNKSIFSKNTPWIDVDLTIENRKVGSVIYKGKYDDYDERWDD